MSTPHLIVHGFRRGDGGTGRYGLVVSRKFGNAVARNRARRQLRDAVVKAGGIPAGLDSVIVAKPGVQLRVAELSREICKIMEVEWVGKGEGGEVNGR